jgi:hypothetical protein
MDNQHKYIRGYRELTEHEIGQINAIKKQGELLAVMIESLRSTKEYDQRWVSIAETHLQQGIMAAVRSVAQPTTF